MTRIVRTMTRERRRLLPIFAVLSVMAFAISLLSSNGPAPAVASTSPKTIFVGGVGALDTNDGLTEGTAKATLAAALLAVSDGDTVQVASGLYVENVTINKVITLRCAKAGAPGDSDGRGLGETVIRGVGNASPTILISTPGVVIDGCEFLRPLVAINGSPVGVELVPRIVESVHVETTVRNSRFNLSTTDDFSSTTRGCGSALWGPAGWIVFDNYFVNQRYNASGCTNSGQRYNSRMIWAEGSPRIDVIGNVFERVDHGVFHTGRAAVGSLIEENIFTGSAQSVLVGRPEGTVIQGNTFRSGNGVYLSGSSGTIVQNNLFCGGSGGGEEAPGEFPDCVNRMGYAVFEEGSSSPAVEGTVIRANAVLGAYSTVFGPPFGGTTIFNAGTGTLVEDNWWGNLEAAGIRAKVSQSGTDPDFVPANWITAYTPSASKQGLPGFWPTCVSMSDAERVINQDVFPCPQESSPSPRSSPSPARPTDRGAEEESAPQAPSTTPSAARDNPPARAPELNQLNLQIRNQPVPSAPRELVPGQPVTVFVDGEVVQARILALSEVVNNAASLFADSPRVTVNANNETLVISNFTGSQALEVSLNDVLIVQIGSLRLAVIALGDNEGERGPGDDGILVVQSDDELVVTVAGLPPGAVFRAFFFSTPTDLGTVIADGNGDVLLRGVLPEDTAAGSHTLQLVTVTSDGNLAEFVVPVLVAPGEVEPAEVIPEVAVEESDELADNQTVAGSTVPVFVWFLVGLLGVLVVVSVLVLVARARKT